MSRALVLNASYEPLCVVSSRRALILVFTEKAELIERTEMEFRSPSVTLPEPSVVRLWSYVRMPFQARVSLNRRAVFARDGHRCQYCGAAAENIDHVIPRSKGGTHSWDNVVAACRPCNTRKEDRFLHEIGFHLVKTPAAPHERIWVLAATGNGSLRADWEPYLGGEPSLSA